MIPTYKTFDVQISGDILAVNKHWMGFLTKPKLDQNILVNSSNMQRQDKIYQYIEVYRKDRLKMRLAYKEMDWDNMH